MKPSAPLLTLALTSSCVFAYWNQIWYNYCDESLYLTLSQDDKGARALWSGAAYQQQLEGQGNVALITKNNDPYSPETPKLVLGSSSDGVGGTLWWSLSSQDGDPFAPDQHFNLTSVDLNVTGPEGVDRCQNATTYDGLVHSCLNTGAVQLGVFLCPFNAAA